MQKPCCYWLTGLSGAGKTTIATMTEQLLRLDGYRTFVLDGDHLRQGLNKNLSFSRADRSENVRRISEVAKLMTEAGLIVFVSAISPYQDDRQAARERFEEGMFFEVFVDTDIATCMKRDPKGLYRMAQEKQITQFTGLDDPYERPSQSDFVIDTLRISAKIAATRIADHYVEMNANWLKTNHPLQHERKISV